MLIFEAKQIIENIHDELSQNALITDKCKEALEIAIMALDAQQMIADDMNDLFDDDLKKKILNDYYYDGNLYGDEDDE